MKEREGKRYNNLKQLLLSFVTIDKKIIPPIYVRASKLLQSLENFRKEKK